MPQIHLGNFGFGIEGWEEMMTESSSPFWVRNNRAYRTRNTENLPNTNKLKLSGTVTFSEAPFSKFWNNGHHRPEAATTDGSSSHLKVLWLADLTEYPPISSLVLFLCKCMQEGILESSSPAQRLYRLCSHCQRKLTYDCTVKKMAFYSPTGPKVSDDSLETSATDSKYYNVCTLPRSKFEELCSCTAQCLSELTGLENCLEPTKYRT